MTAHHFRDNLDVKLRAFEPYRERLGVLYSQMDEKYKGVAGKYGFECRGCEESCCETRFFHHTWVEFLYLLEGFQSIGGGHQLRIKKTAAGVDKKHRMAEEKGQTVRIMCPLNEDGWCILYGYRPMICRLHGIPHELRKPGQNTVYGPGCEFFSDRFGKISYVPFDRTPFYRKLAVLEQEFRQVTGTNEKIKMTIAEMILPV